MKNKIFVSCWVAAAFAGFFGYLAGANDMKQKTEKALIDSELQRERDQIEVINLIFKKKD